MSHTLNWKLGLAMRSLRRCAQTAEMSVAVYCSSSQWLSASSMANTSRVRPPVPAPTSHAVKPEQARQGVQKPAVQPYQIARANTCRVRPPVPAPTSHAVKPEQAPAALRTLLGLAGRLR